MKLAVLGCLLVGAEAHVAMTNVGANFPIRNANSPTGNGRASVAGGCGGVNTWGANGNGQITDGDTVTLNINYAAGHNSPQNAFHFAYSCADTSQAGMESEAAVLTAATDGCTATVSGTPAPYTDNGVDGGVAAPNAIVPGGYDVTCTLPSQNNNAQVQCTMAIIDQRDWGGCVDVLVLPAAVPAPPAPPPAPYQSSKGKYYIIEANSVDGSAASFTNCNFGAGYLEVPSYSQGSTSFTAELKAQADNCRATPVPIDPNTGVEAPKTNTIQADLSFTMSLDPNTPENQNSPTPKFSGIAAIPYDQADKTKTQPYMFTVAGTAMQFAYFNPQNPSEQPIINDGFSDPQVQGLSVPFGDDDSSNSTTIAVVVVVVILVLLGVIGYCWCRHRSSSAGGTASKAAAYTGTQYGAAYGQGGAPPPPPPPGPPPPGGAGLPPGWVEMKDANSGQTYYHNAAMNATQWEKPGGGRV